MLSFAKVVLTFDLLFFFFQGSGGYLKRANPDKLKEVFIKYASIEKEGVKYMTSSDFIQSYLGILTGENTNKESVRLLAGIVDTSKDGLISFAEFQAFEGLLCLPDALYKTAFQLFDTNGNGMVSFGKNYWKNRHFEGTQSC